MKREEFLNQIEGYVFPKLFNQDLLDRAAEMFGRWGRALIWMRLSISSRALAWPPKRRIAMRSRSKKRH